VKFILPIFTVWGREFRSLVNRETFLERRSELGLDTISVTTIDISGIRTHNSLRTTSASTAPMADSVTRKQSSYLNLELNHGLPQSKKQIYTTYTTCGIAAKHSYLKQICVLVINGFKNILFKFVYWIIEYRASSGWLIP